MQKIYISGSGGMLGEALYSVFKENYKLKCSDIDQNEDWIDYLDFRNLNEYRNDVKNFSPEYLFHIGAFTDLEFCEKNPDETYITNTLSVKNATNISNELNIPLIFISTAGVFDGKKEFYDDWDIPNPQNHYGKSKYEAEKFIQLHAKKSIICRAGWMMGGGPKKDKKFVNKIIQQIKKGNKTLNVVDDKAGTPTYTYDFANNLKSILENNLFGLYNLVGQGEANRFDVACKILEIFNLKNKIKINRVKSTFFKNEYFAMRPPSEQLINKKLELKSMNYMRDWKICIEEYLNKNYYNYL